MKKHFGSRAELFFYLEERAGNWDSGLANPKGIVHESIIGQYVDRLWASRDDGNNVSITDDALAFFDALDWIYQHTCPVCGEPAPDCYAYESSPAWDCDNCSCI